MDTAESDSQVQYRDSTDFPGYRVDSDGNVWSCWRTRPGGRFQSQWRRLKASPSGKGYLRVNLTSGAGEVKMFRVHVLVLTVFVGPCPDGMECRHRNGVKTDNRLSNLAWGTPEENRQDNHDAGAYARGQSHTQAKLTEEAVGEIRRRYSGGVLMRDLATEYGVKLTTVHAVVRRRSWKHVT